MKRLFLFIFILLVLGGGAAYLIVPGHSLAEQRIIAFLNDRGITDVAFNIDKVGLHEATFNNIQIGQEDPFRLQFLTVQYSPKEVIRGNIRDIVLTGLDIQILQTQDGWKIAGFGDLQSRSAKSDTALTFSDMIDLLPFSNVKVTDSYLRISGNAVQTSLPFNMNLTKNPSPVLEMTINASNISAASSQVSLGVVTLKAAPDASRNWNGEWTLDALNLGEKLPIPVLNGAGTLNNAGDIVTIDGALGNGNKAYNASFSMLLDLKAGEKNVLTLKSAAFPFKGGRVSAKDTRIPFDRKKNIAVNLNVRKVLLNDLLQTLTGQRVTATGTVSGRMPIILRPDGSYTLGKGTLKADSKGLIQMPGDAIPGNNEQVQLVREILNNLHYAAFSAAVDTSGADGLVVRLSLEGNNPDVYNGRIVKLNVNLTGDVLDFIQQNAMLFTNPEKLLEQGTQ